MSNVAPEFTDSPGFDDQAYVYKSRGDVTAAKFKTKLKILESIDILLALRIRYDGLAKSSVVEYADWLVE